MSEQVSKQIDEFLEKRLSSAADVMRQKDISPHQQQVYDEVNAIRQKYGQEWHPSQSPNRIMSPEERREKYALARKHGIPSSVARSLRDKHYATMGKHLGLRKSIDDFVNKWSQGVIANKNPNAWNPFKRKEKVKYNKPEHENIRVKPEAKKD